MYDTGGARRASHTQHARTAEQLLSDGLLVSYATLAKEAGVSVAAVQRFAWRHKEVRALWALVDCRTADAHNRVKIALRKLKAAGERRSIRTITDAAGVSRATVSKMLARFPELKKLKNE